MGKGFKLASIPIIDYNYKVPYKELFTHLQSRQLEYDENAAKLDALENSWLTLQTVPGEEQLGLDIQKSYDDKVNNVTQTVGGDLSKADGLIREVSKGLKRDMTTGPFSKVQANYTNYKALSEYLSTAVNESDPKKRVERDRADQWLNMSLHDFYSQGGTQGGASFSSRKPLTFVDINSKINKFLEGWKPDTQVGNIIKQVDGSGNVTYVKQQGQYSADGLFYTTDQYEIANPDEIRNAIIQHIESDPMASQYIEEGIMLNMQGMTPELLASDEGKGYLKTAREELSKLPQFNKEDVKNMNDMSVIANAMKYAELQNMAEPFVDREGYEKHTQNIKTMPEWFYKNVNGIVAPDVNAAETYSSVTPLVKGDVNVTTYKTVSDLANHKTELEALVAANDIQQEEYKERLRQNPKDVTALQKIGQLQSEKQLVTNLLNDLNTNYGDILEEIVDKTKLDELGEGIHRFNTDYFDRDIVLNQWYEGQFLEFLNTFENTHVGPDKQFKNGEAFFQAIVDHIDGKLDPTPGESKGDDPGDVHKWGSNMPWLYPDFNEYSDDKKLQKVMSGMHTLNSAPEAWMRVEHGSAWDTPVKEALQYYGLWDDDKSNSENFESNSAMTYIKGFLAQNGMQNKTSRENLKELNKPRHPEQLPFINFGTSGETGNMSMLSKKVSRMYTADPGSFVVYDINGGKVLDYADNPQQLQIDGVLLEPFGDGGHWLRAFTPKYNDKDEVVRDAQGTPMYDQSYLVATNPYVGSGSQIFRMISDELSTSDDNQAVELSRRLREQSFRTKLQQFEVLTPPGPGDPAQTVTVPIGDDDYIRVDRTTFGPKGQTEEYRIYHDDYGGYIPTENDTPMVFYSLQEVTEAYRRLNERILGGSVINKNTNETQTTTIPRQQKSDFLEVPGASAGILNLSNKYGFNTDELISLIGFETAGTYSPAIQNSNSGATGLIQFTGETAKALGTTTEALKSMDVKEQMKWIDKYFERQLKTFPDLEGMHPYLWVAAPAISKLPYDYSVLWSPDSKEAKANPSWTVKDGDISNQNGAPVGSVTRYSILASLTGR